MVASVASIEEPTVQFVACYYPEATDTLNFLTDAMNYELSGLETAEVRFTPAGEDPMMQKVFDRTSQRERAGDLSRPGQMRRFNIRNEGPDG
jgi:hypothetical protein